MASRGRPTTATPHSHRECMGVSGTPHARTPAARTTRHATASKPHTRPLWPPRCAAYANHARVAAAHGQWPRAHARRHAHRANVTQRRATHASRTGDGRPSHARRPRINTGKLAMGSHCAQPVQRLSAQKAPGRRHRKVTAIGKHAAQSRAARRCAPSSPRGVAPDREASRAPESTPRWMALGPLAHTGPESTATPSKHWRAAPAPSDTHARQRKAPINKSESTASGGRDSQTRTHAERQHRLHSRKALRVRSNVTKPAARVTLHARLT